MEDVRQVLTDLNIRPVTRDQRHSGQPLRVTFHGELRPEQKLAADAMLKYETGVLSATTAFGQTVVAAWLIAQRNVNTLVGEQHLADPIAYRRDRRKDQLLQENGSLVLRYLAEDLSKELDSVFGGVLRALSVGRKATSAVTIPMAAVQRSRV